MPSSECAVATLLSARPSDSAQLPVDLRRPFVGSILVCGGTGMLPGLQARLHAEVAALLVGPKLAPLRDSAAILNDRAPAFAPSLLAWLGGSLAGSLKSGGEDVSREKWDAAAAVDDDVDDDDYDARRSRRQASLLPNIVSSPLR